MSSKIILLMSFNEKKIPDRLLDWPAYITLRECKEKIEENQVIVIEQVRSQFCKKIINAINNSIPSICLTFPNNILNSNKNIIILELIERFGAITITGEFDNYTSCEINCVNCINDIPPNPTKIFIEFLKEN
jgi:hypothetical protein